jgi:hypothetical protein
MSRQVSPSTSRPYEVLRVARVWGTSRATLYRHRRCNEPGPRGRPGPLGPLPDEALVETIRKLLADSPFHGEGYRKIWARLRFAGLRTSKRRVLRLMRARLAGARPGRPAAWPEGPRRHDPHRAGGRNVGHGPDFDPDRRGPGGDLRHGGSRLDRMPRHPRCPTCDPVRGARAAPSGRARLLRCLRRRDRRRPEAASRSRQPVRRR